MPEANLPPGATRPRRPARPGWGRRARRVVLSVHLVCSLGWVGAALAYLALALTAANSVVPGTFRAAWWAMELIGWAVVTPLAVAALASGVLLALASPWGLLRYTWVLASLGLTTLACAITVGHMVEVTATATRVREAPDTALATLGSDLVHPSAGLVVLLAITALNVAKPGGRTSFGRTPAPPDA